MTIKILRDLSDEHLAAIGRVVTNFSGLDVAIDFAIAKLLNVHSGVHAALTIGVNTDAKLDMIQNLAETTLPAGRPRTELLQIVKDIRPKCTDRNFIAHAHWLNGTVNSPKIFGYLGKKNKLGAREADWTAKDINKMAEDILTLEGRLLTWVYRKTLRKKHVTWRDRHLPPAQRSRPLNLLELYRAIQIPLPRSSRQKSPIAK